MDRLDGDLAAANPQYQAIFSTSSSLLIEDSTKCPTKKK